MCNGMYRAPRHQVNAGYRIQGCYALGICRDDRTTLVSLAFTYRTSE